MQFANPILLLSASREAPSTGVSVFTVVSPCMLSLNVGSFFLIHIKLPDAAVCKVNLLFLIPFPSLLDFHPHKNLHVPFTADLESNQMWILEIKGEKKVQGLKLLPKNYLPASLFESEMVWDHSSTGDSTVYLIYPLHFQHWIRIPIHTWENQEGRKTTACVSLHTEAAVISPFNCHSGKAPKSRFIVAGPDSPVSPSCFMGLLCHEAPMQSALSSYHSPAHSRPAHNQPMWLHLEEGSVWWKIWR